MTKKHSEEHFKQKEKKLGKLAKEKYLWAYEIQSKPIPNWVEAFEYAYNLGLDVGMAKAKGYKTGRGEEMI